MNIQNSDTIATTILTPRHPTVLHSRLRLEVFVDKPHVSGGVGVEGRSIALGAERDGAVLDHQPLRGPLA